MTSDTPRRRSLWAYNIRILLGNTYWLIITPIVATQFVVFWSMATSTLFSSTRAAQTIEVLAPILGAFLCAHVLAPEQDGVGEIVFVRPISVEKILLLRFAAIFAFVFAILIPAFVVYKVGAQDFPLGVTVLSAIPPMLFLSVLAMAVSSVTRQPLIGLGAAGAFWALDLTVGAYFNPLVSLHGYADFLANRPMAGQWVVSKLVLLGLAGLVYLWARRSLGRPAAPRRARAVVRGSLALVLLCVVYIATGAAYKVAYGMRHEAELGKGAHLWYQREFRGYGPLPVAWMFGPAFPLYVQAEMARNVPLAGAGQASLWAPVDIAAMKKLVRRYPNSVWADNAQFEIARDFLQQPAAEALDVVSYTAGRSDAERRSIAQDLRGAIAEFRALVERYPRSPFAAQSLEQIATISLALLDFPEAISAYERILSDYPTSPQAYEAGVRMSALYMHEGRPKDARRAAELAAAAATWDVKAGPLVVAARAARQVGDTRGALDLYGKALAAAQDAIERSVRGEKAPTRIAKPDLFDRNNAAISEAREALAGRPRPVPIAPQQTARVVGRVIKEGEGAPGVRVAIGAEADPGGMPSPFVEGPGVSAVTGPDGRFEMPQVPLGQYAAAAFAVPRSRDSGGWVVEPPSLPLLVASSQVVIPPLHLVPARLEASEPPSGGPRAATSPGRRPGPTRTQRDQGRAATRGGQRARPGTSDNGTPGASDRESIRGGARGRSRDRSLGWPRRGQP